MDLPNLPDASKYLGRPLLGPDQAALNAQFGKPVEDANYEFQSGGNVYRVANGTNGTRSVTQSGTVAERMAAKAKADRLAAIQPAIQSYEGTKPEIEKAYATEQGRLTGEIGSLNERYKILLDDIKGREQKEADSATLRFKQEMGKRGLALDDTIIQQELAKNVDPIRQNYGNLFRTATQDNSDLIRGINDTIAGLVPKKTADLRGITQAIADLQTGAGNQSITDWLGLTQQGFENSLAERKFQEEQRQFGIQEALERLKAQGSGGAYDNFVKIGEGESIFDLLSGKSIYDKGKTYKSVGGAAGGDSLGLR